MKTCNQQERVFVSRPVDYTINHIIKLGMKNL